MIRSRFALPLLLAFLFVGACGGRQTPAPDDLIEDPVVLYEAMLTRLEPLESARIRATLEYYGEEGRARITQAVLVRKDADVRLETISPMDTSLSVLLLNEDELVFYDLQSESYYTGAPTAENVARLAPLYLTPADIVRVMLGGPPLDFVEQDLDAMELEWDGRNAMYKLRMPAPDGGELVLWVRDGSWTLGGAMLLDADGENLLELRAGDFANITSEEGVSTELPLRFRFLMPSEDIDISLEVERFDLNADLNDMLFRLAPPRGVEVLPL